MVEKANTLLQTSPSAEVSQFTKDTQAKYTALLNMAKEAIAKSEDHVTHHTTYQDSFQVACDWLRLMKDRLSMCTEMAGDKHSVTNKLERVKVSGA